MNRWGIPKEVEEIVLRRDSECIYCRTTFHSTERKRKASWEHIINDAKITTLENIALCCVSCNASKGTKTLGSWFNGKYCLQKNINIETVAEIVRSHIEKYGFK